MRALAGRQPPLEVRLHQMQQGGASLAALGQIGFHGRAFAAGSGLVEARDQVVQVAGIVPKRCAGPGCVRRHGRVLLRSSSLSGSRMRIFRTLRSTHLQPNHGPGDGCTDFAKPVVFFIVLGK
jgi:hypothetical protein